MSPVLIFIFRDYCRNRVLVAVLTLGVDSVSFMWQSMRSHSIEAVCVYHYIARSMAAAVGYIAPVLHISIIYQLVLQPLCFGLCFFMSPHKSQRKAVFVGGPGCGKVRIPVCRMQNTQHSPQFALLYTMGGEDRTDVFDVCDIIAVPNISILTWLQEDFSPRMTDGYQCINVNIDDSTKVDLELRYANGHMDRSGERLRSLSYPNTHIFLLCFALNDPASLRTLVDYVRSSGLGLGSL
jgi:hypothetical protein